MPTLSVCLSSLFITLKALVLPAAAAENYLEDCNRGSSSSCHVLGNRFSNQDNAQDQLKGVSFYRRACDRDFADSCDALGYAYFKGRGVSVDLVKAASFYRKACELGQPSSCDSVNVEVLKGRKQSENDTFKKAQEGCEREQANACWDLANEYDHLGGPLNSEKSVPLYLKACNLGQPGGCVVLASMYERGRGVSGNVVKAKALYAKAIPLYLSGCEDRHGQSCKLLGNFYENGQGVDKDNEKALTFYRKGCEFGDKGACRNVDRLTSSSREEK